MAVAVAYAICAIVWGTTWFAIRVCIQTGGYPTLPAAALRFTIAALILSLILAAGAGKPRPSTRRQWLGLTIAGVANALSYGLVYTGEERISGGVAAVLFATLPLWTAFLAATTRTERVSGRQVVGALVAVGGIAILSWERLSVSAEQGVGIAIVLAAVWASAFYSLLLKRSAGPTHPLASTAVFLWVTAAVLWLYASVSAPIELPWPPPPRPTIALLYLAVLGSVLTFGCYLFLLQRTSLMATTTLVFLQPLIALIVDALWEREIRLTAHSYLGALGILAGVFITVALGRRRAVR